MTNMDKKINELNAKLGKKTGVDFKATGTSMAKELYANKPVYFGTLAGAGAFVFTSTGLIASALIGGAYGLAYKLYSDNKIKKES